MVADTARLEHTTPIATAPPRVRGVDHIGLTVPDLDSATDFFVRALGASVLYDALPPTGPSRAGAALEARLGVPPGTVQVAIRLLGLPDGPSLELFCYLADEQREPARPNDFGWQHVAFYVDDIEAAARSVVAAGGVTLGAPRPLSGVEAGARNRFLYCRSPWGSTVELISYPDPQPYEQHTGVRRWRPGESWVPFA